MKDVSELNEELAKWAGVKPFPIYPTGYDYPDFTESLDDCFEYLVPKIINDSRYRKARIEIRTWYAPAIEEYQSKATIYSYGRGIDKSANTPALALCKAIERLIEEGGR